MATSQDRSWQSHPEKRGQAKFSRDLRRASIVTALLVASAVLIYLLVPPFFYPQTHLVLIGAHGEAGFNAPPIPFVEEDHEAFDDVVDAKVRDQSAVWASNKSARSLASSLSHLGAGGNDNLIVYLTAHGVSDDSKAYLLCDNFDLRRSDSGRISVERLLSQVRQSPAANKLVILNAGSIDYDPRMGVFGNEFVRLLRQAVHETNDSSLWVYCSHSPLQVSHASPAAQRSVFGMFVSEALKGAADLNRDRFIRMSELAGFTSANVSQWVQQSTDQSIRQDPQLFWGGGPNPSADPTILTLREPGDPSRLTVAALIDRAGPEAASAASLGGGQVQGLIRRRQVTLASNSVKTPDGESANADSGGDAAEAGDAEADTEGDAAESGQDDTDGEAGDEGGATEAVADTDPAAGAKKQIASAWQTRDEVADDWNRLNPNLAPPENKPHLWREFQAELVAFEQRIRGGKAYDPAAIESVLRDSVPSPEAGPGAAEPAGEKAAKGPSVAEQLFGPASVDGAAIVSAVNGAAVKSIALDEVAATIDGKELAFDLDGLKKVLELDDRKPLDEWLKANWHSRYRDYLDVGFIKRLSDDEELDWSLIRTASKASLAGERVAALDVLSPGWVRDDVQRADQFRFFAQQLVFDQVGLQWRERLQTLFADALAIYEAALEGFDEVRDSQRELDLVLDRLPWYLQWDRDTSSGTGEASAVTAQLESLVDQTKQLATLLDQPSPANAAALASMRVSLQSIRSRVESECGDVAAAKILQRSAAPGDSFYAASLLQTPVLGAESRTGLMSAITTIDKDLASDFKLANVSAADIRARGVAGEWVAPSREGWKNMLRRAQLQTDFILLSKVHGEHRSVDPGNDVSGPVEDAFKNLSTAHQSAMNATEFSGETLWEAYEEFGEALQTFYRSAVQSSGAVAVDASNARRAIRLLRMIDPRDAWQLADIDTESLSLRHRIDSSLRWQATRRVQAMNYRGVAGIDIRSLADSDFDSGSSAQNPSANPREAVESIRVESPADVDLQYADRRDVPIVLSNQGEGGMTVNLSLDYDRELIDVTLPEKSGRMRFVDGASQFETRRTNSIELGSGEELRLMLRVDRRSGASESGKLVIDVYAKSSLVRSAASAPVLLRRRSVDVMLPVGEVFVRQGKKEYVSGAEGVELLPHPNRLEQFLFGVVNHSSRTKTIEMRCYPQTQPLGGHVSPGMVSALSASVPLAKFDLVVPGNGEPTFPSAGEPEAKEDGAAAGDDAEEDKAETEKEDVSEAKPIESTEMPEGMLVLLTDTETGQSTLRRVRFSVQRPRRFVMPRVGFDAIKKQIQVNVKAVDVAAIPAGAPIRVSCELADDLAGRVKGKLQGLITRERPEVNLFIAVPMPPPVTSRIYIDVDGYPRAFIFDVPCGKHLNQIAETTGEVDLRMVTSSRSGVLSATNSIPVSLQLDVPVGSFENGNDHLDLGLDLESTGTPNPENSVRLTNDRAVRVGFVKSLPTGVVDLHSVVQDHQIELPAERLENLEIDVAAELTINDRARSFPSIPLLIDTAAPIVGPVSNADGLPFVASETQFDVIAFAWDEGAGVSKIEAAFDLVGTGEFPEGGAEFTGSRTSNREWIVSVNSGADAGKKTLLVRGVDAVGNTSDPVSLEIEVVSAGESEKRVKEQTVEVTGTILYRDKALTDAEVVLIAIPEDGEPGADAAAEPAAGSGLTAVSTENGAYSIPNVSPGSYQLQARSVIRNRVFRTEKEVVVAVGPKRQIRVDVVLR